MHHRGRRLHDCRALLPRPSNDRTCGSCDSQENEVAALPPLACLLRFPPQSFRALMVVLRCVCVCVCSATARWSSRGFCTAPHSRQRARHENREEGGAAESEEMRRRRMMRRSSSSREDNKTGGEKVGLLPSQGSTPWPLCGGSKQTV